MTDYDFILELYCRVDTVLREVPKHNQASLYPGEVVTLCLLFALQLGLTMAAFNRKEFVLCYQA